MAIDKKTLDILVCPQCLGPIHINPSQDGLICDKCRLLYQIKDDIPNMVIGEAKKIIT